MRSEVKTAWRTPSIGQVFLDQLHHRRDREVADRRQPFVLGVAEPLAAVARGQRRADRLQVLAGIQPFGDRGDGLAQRLAVAQVDRAGELVDLGAGVVDVVLARDGEAGLLEQRRQRVADHGAAAMADMHRPGRVGRDVLDIDRRAACPIVESP